MSYPLSTTVSAGQPTAATQYNNLRADALYLGQSSADGVSIGEILADFQYNVTLEYLATNKVRVPATAAAPAQLAIDGVLLSATAYVDLPVAPSGSAMTYYVFAQRSASSTTFTLVINSSPAETTSYRKIGSFYWDGSAIVRQSIRTDYQDSLNTLLPLQSQLASVVEGRLTLTTGTPVTTSDVNSAGTLYFTPYKGSHVALYVPGFGWKVYAFTEISLSLSSVSNATNYDVYLYDNAGVLTLSLDAWASDTARSVALVTQDGVLCRSGQVYKRYLGTIRGSGANVTADSITQRFVWNQYNQEMRRFYITEATSHTYTGSTANRMWNNSATNSQMMFVLGRPTTIWARLRVTMSVSSNAAMVYITVDGTTTYFNGQVFTGTTNSSTLNLGDSGVDTIAEGYHYLQISEAISLAGATGTYVNLYSSAFLMG